MRYPRYCFQTGSRENTLRPTLTDKCCFHLVRLAQKERGFSRNEKAHDKWMRGPRATQGKKQRRRQQLKIKDDNAWMQARLSDIKPTISGKAHHIKVLPGAKHKRENPAGQGPSGMPAGGLAGVASAEELDEFRKMLNLRTARLIKVRGEAYQAAGRS